VRVSADGQTTDNFCSETCAVAAMADHIATRRSNMGGGQTFGIGGNPRMPVARSARKQRKR
jgi:hypothetical protein